MIERIIVDAAVVVVAEDEDEVLVISSFPLFIII